MRIAWMTRPVMQAKTVFGFYSSKSRGSSLLYKVPLKRRSVNSRRQVRIIFTSIDAAGCPRLTLLACSEPNR
jgi:hypothetical protein